MVRPRQSAGFSLIELMVVVTIVGIMSAAIVPAMGDVLADHRAASAAMDVLRLARRARSLTLANGTAYMLTAQRADPASLGSLTLVQGMNARCLQTLWNAAVGRPGETIGLGAGMAYYNPIAGGRPLGTDANRQVIVLQPSIDGGNVVSVQICYQPNGEVYIQRAADATMLRQANTMLVTLTVTRTVAGVPHGQTREVIFPNGGSARMH
jgi:prepilin-type N-terminal cleavage/methylation domain-containing protein